MTTNIKFKKLLQEFEHKYEPHEALRFELGKECPMTCDRKQAHVSVKIAASTVKGTREELHDVDL